MKEVRIRSGRGSSEHGWSASLASGVTGVAGLTADGGYALYYKNATVADLIEKDQALSLALNDEGLRLANLNPFDTVIVFCIDQTARRRQLSAVRDAALATEHAIRQGEAVSALTNVVSGAIPLTEYDGMNVAVSHGVIRVLFSTATQRPVGVATGSTAAWVNTHEVHQISYVVVIVPSQAILPQTSIPEHELLALEATRRDVEFLVGIGKALASV